MLNITEKMMPNKKHLMKSCWWRMDGLGRSSMFLLQVILLHLKEHEIVFCFFQNLSQYCASSQGTQDFLVSFKISLKTFNRTHSDNLEKNTKNSHFITYTLSQYIVFVQLLLHLRSEHPKGKDIFYRMSFKHLYSFNRQSIDTLTSVHSVDLCTRSVQF